MSKSRLVFRLIIGAALLVPPAVTQAQGQIGAIVGATFSTLRGVDDLDSRTGLLGGLALVLPTSGPLGLEIDGLFELFPALRDVRRPVVALSPSTEPRRLTSL